MFDMDRTDERDRADLIAACEMAGDVIRDLRRELDAANDLKRSLLSETETLRKCLRNAVGAAFNAGAVEWVQKNHPEYYLRIKGGN